MNPFLVAGSDGFSLPPSYRVPTQDIYFGERFGGRCPNWRTFLKGPWTAPIEREEPNHFR